MYKPTLHEVGEVFGTGSARRKLLIGNFENIVELAKSTGKLERVIGWGSFVSNKEFPQDIDLLLIKGDGFDVDANPPEVKKVFDYIQGRIAFDADISCTKSSIGEEAIDLWLETYQMTREFESRGIVEVMISDKE